jgi:hypothetical protein
VYVADKWIIKLGKPSAGVVRVIGIASEGIPNYPSHGLNTPEKNLVSTVEIVGTVTERERERERESKWRPKTRRPRKGVGYSREFQIFSVFSKTRKPFVNVRKNESFRKSEHMESKVFGKVWKISNSQIFFEN